MIKAVSLIFSAGSLQYQSGHVYWSCTLLCVTYGAERAARVSPVVYHQEGGGGLWLIAHTGGAYCSLQSSL